MPITTNVYGENAGQTDRHRHTVREIQFGGQLIFDDGTITNEIRKTQKEIIFAASPPMVIHNESESTQTRPLSANRLTAGPVTRYSSFLCIITHAFSLDHFTLLRFLSIDDYYL